MSRPAVAAWIAVAFGLAIGAFSLGRSFGAEEAPIVSYDFTAPAYEAAASIAGRSRGGFTGFAEVAGLDGRTVIAGRVAGLSTSALVLDTAVGQRSLRLTGDRALRRIEPWRGAEPGSTVALLLTPNGNEVAAVLVLSAP